EGLEKGLLRQVLGIGAGPGHAGDDGEDSVPESIDDLATGGLVAGAQAGHEGLLVVPHADLRAAPAWTPAPRRLFPLTLGPGGGLAGRRTGGRQLQLVAQLVALGPQVALVVAVGRDLQGDALRDLQAVARERVVLAGVVGQQ